MAARSVELGVEDGLAGRCLPAAIGSSVIITRSTSPAASGTAAVAVPSAPGTNEAEGIARRVGDPHLVDVAAPELVHALHVQGRGLVIDDERACRSRLGVRGSMVSVWASSPSATT